MTGATQFPYRASDETGVSDEFSSETMLRMNECKFVKTIDSHCYSLAIRPPYNIVSFCICNSMISDLLNLLVDFVLHPQNPQNK